jgi:hypothetical protein
MESLTAALGPAINSDAGEAATVFLVTAERMLRELVADGETDRSVAETLLTIDALTTYALESASELAEGLGPFADDALTRFSSTRAQLDVPPGDE